MKAVVLALALALTGCGTDGGGDVSMDMAQPILDIATVGHACGALVCSGSCTGCINFGGGVCVTPCKRAAPSCASGSCMPLQPADGGAGASVVLDGDCAGYDGYCG
ncbi:MAG TPA: hypothetical protein VF334_12290 [Polyangia bacterium]